MIESNNDQLLLESIIGAPVIGVQVPVDLNLPIKFPRLIHYELYKNHIELHVESSSYLTLCSFLEKQLPNDETSEIDEVWMRKHCTKCKRRDFCTDPIA